MTPLISLRGLERFNEHGPGRTYGLRRIDLDIAEGEFLSVMELFKTLNAGGTTIIQVTHSDTNASYGDRVVQLRDGWMVTH